MESKFDVEQIARDRERLESTHQALLAFFEQLKKSDELRIQVKELRAKIQELGDAQALDATALARIQNQDWPMAENAVQIAKAQLDLMIAAIDDHAKRLRTSLQENQECPVCGSTSHPYTQHAPQQDAVAAAQATSAVRRDPPAHLAPDRGAVPVAAAQRLGQRTEVGGEEHCEGDAISMPARAGHGRLPSTRAARVPA